MASCRNCGAKFGCGCQLINGLCAACNAATKQSKNFIRNVVAKAHKLSRMC
jgi:hypothetical protein